MNIFDMIGPVMIGPSSSHTAGAARLGYLAGRLLGQPPGRADIYLYGSFAKTYKGHGTDKAIIAGILGMRPDDERLADSFSVAKRQKLDFTFLPAEGVPGTGAGHPNTVKIVLYGRQIPKQETIHTVSMVGASIGGGSVSISNINDMPVSISGQYDCLTVMHNDTPGTIAAVTEMIARHGINICNISLSRQERGGLACMTIEIDGRMDKQVPNALRSIPNVTQVTYLSLE